MIVFYFACIYWGGVAINAARIRKRTGRTPSLKPRLKVDFLLWPGWIAIVVLWAATPWIVDQDDFFFGGPVAGIVGLVIASAGLMGTWWCYATLGDAWAISQHKERTNALIRSGPYGIVRHPIYSFQWLIVAGLFIFAPAWPLAVALVLLSVCMQIKGRVEEKGLQELFGAEYAEYSREVGRFVPGL